MKKKLTGVCFGEILFDVFLEHKKIGGAPLNVASRLNSLGGDIAMISSIGNDTNGKILVDYLNNSGIKTKAIQVSDTYPTGIVNVILNEKGNASYDINYPAAWDKIESSLESIEIVKNADFLVYGSLSSRDLVSKKTLNALLKVAKYKIFDVNLRSPHYAKKTIKDLLDTADFIKFNDDELNEICKDLNSNKKSLEQNIKFISEVTNTNTVCVTLGSHGAVLYFENTFYYNCGFKVNVVDTVGSGDSFLASLIMTLLNEEDPQFALNQACAIGAIVAQSEGANPVILQSEIDEFLCGFELTNSNSLKSNPFSNN
ncbi:carbohydrate kinase family protein [Flavobacterium cellulosilyticum]|uniref:Carbohydrate kinase n=1 Tax=Flavobacterium cellulosilyticum TaxID=2541731 RepID=A0A4V2YYY4_9FLAO|nr:carbohydrate kinase [Flavobacterium cellulosilyticum]TDD94887.1 carbohydrate kinase [Flavobacterium cellulosilyticum]